MIEEFERRILCGSTLTAEKGIKKNLLREFNRGVHQRALDISGTRKVEYSISRVYFLMSLGNGKEQISMFRMIKVGTN